MVRIGAINTVLYREYQFSYDRTDFPKQAANKRLPGNLLRRGQGTCANLPDLYYVVADRLGFPVYDEPATSLLAPPFWLSRQINASQQSGPRGDGRAGGGGGGNRGTGGNESLRFFRVPAPGTPVPVVPEVLPPIPPEEKKPEPEPPKPEPAAPAKPDPAAAASKAGEVESVVPGTGGGAGKDGTAGSGPGSGGGVGSGVGTGRGSGSGSGTGGGNDDSEIFPPTVTQLAILPLPVPGKVRPYRMVAYFEVDTLGVAKLLSFNPSNDNGYNRRIREMLAEIRFRPAVTKSGRAVLDTAIVTAEALR